MTIQECIGNKVAINCRTEREAVEFFDLCCQNNINVWNNDRPLMEEGTHFSSYKKNTTYRISSNRKILYGTDTHFLENKYDVVQIKIFKV